MTDDQMPELPEVETLRRQLESEFAGRKIKAVPLKSKGFVSSAAVVKGKVVKTALTQKGLSDLVVGAKIETLERSGKYLRVELDNERVWLMHLGMSGHLVKLDSRRPPDKHTAWELEFTQGVGLRYFDARRLGSSVVASLVDTEQVLGNVGLDALNQVVPWQMLGDLFASKSVGLKVLLLDQQFIAGIGNIYSNEILFVAGLSPVRSSDGLSASEVRRLSRATSEVLMEAVKNRGTTLEDDGWHDLEDLPGQHQLHLYVHGKDGKMCPRCRAIIAKSKIGGRGAYFCPQCQK